MKRQWNSVYIKPGALDIVIRWYSYIVIMRHWWKDQSPRTLAADATTGEACHRWYDATILRPLDFYLCNCTFGGPSLIKFLEGPAFMKPFLKLDVNSFKLLVLSFYDYIISLWYKG